MRPVSRGWYNDWWRVSIVDSWWVCCHLWFRTLPRSSCSWQRVSTGTGTSLWILKVLFWVKWSTLTFYYVVFQTKVFLLNNFLYFSWECIIREQRLWHPFTLYFHWMLCLWCLSGLTLVWLYSFQRQFLRNRHKKHSALEWIGLSLQNCTIYMHPEQIYIHMQNIPLKIET